MKWRREDQAIIDIPNFSQATLPTDRTTGTIEAMDYGESGWTVPWAMYADKNRRLWLNGSYTLNSTPGGTVQLMIVRDTDGRWLVDASRCKNETWKPGTPCYMGEYAPIAVATVKWR